MAAYFLRRTAYAILLTFIMSVLSFIVIQLPPGDYASSYVARVSSAGMTEERRQQLLVSITQRYALDRPLHEQYFTWITNILTKGDFGMSFNWNRPVQRIIAERLPLTITLGLVTLFFQYIVAIPMGIYSAIKQYTKGDYIITFLSFVGVSIPNFLLALVAMVLLFTYFGISIGGLFSPEYREAAWSVGKVIDLLKHLIVPVMVIGFESTAGTVRTLRATMLDELGKDYMKVAKAKGLSNRAATIKHAVRIALNPIIASLGWQLPVIVSGSTIVAIVVGIPTVGPVLHQALLSQDMYLAGGIILVLSALTIFGTLLSDFLLAISDPRISYDTGGK